MDSVTRTLFLSIAVAAGLSAGNTYTVTNVCPASISAGSCGVSGINSGGQVVGSAMGQRFDPPQPAAFEYTGGTPTELPFGVATAINNSGVITGSTGGLSVSVPDGYVYSGGVATVLTPLSGFVSAWPNAINSSGQVVGYVRDSGATTFQAFLYSGGVMSGLGTLTGGTNSWATGINTSGQIVGYATNASGRSEAFLYTNGIMVGLGTLTGYSDSFATAINDQGQIAGYVADLAGNTQAFLYSGGTMRGLGSLPGYAESRAAAINGKGDIVGYAAPTLGSGAWRAFLYSGGQMNDLNSLVSFASDTFVQATGINDSRQIVANGNVGAYLLSPLQGRFVAVTPCRVADTRLAPGQFGGPALAARTPRSFTIPQSACGIPATAQAYSLNVTVVPQGPLSYLTLWPTGMAQPLVSTLNSWDGSVVANAAIVPAGQDGAVSVYATNPTDVILDIDGYFDPNAGDTFYPVQPCRVADTRYSAGLLGSPAMAAHATRDFPILSSPCGLSAAVTAYSMNVTVVPQGPLAFLTTWAAGQPQPNVSTLNSPGKVVANAAIVPAGTGGATSVYVTNPTQVILDTNGYFAPAGSAGALTFYPVVPCRVADTRGANGAFGGPEMDAGTTRTFDVPAGGCSIPSTAAAYSLNVTVVPDSALSFLTAWPAGALQPFVSTLNSFDGAVVANAAIVPAGTGGAINVYVTNPTHVVLDINGYFAP
jgi:probable HAF family extracellular repeat protein